MNRICYRFIDSPYRKEFFIDENRTAFSGTERIRMALDKYEVDYSRIIYTYEEYRNILYGNGVEAELKKYSLMESKQYQNIPRTIQNVLLNSKLDAEFIKKTIISSINEEETAIDLNSYKEHLKNFETRLHDIEEFQKKETQKLCKEITRCSLDLNRKQTALVQDCKELRQASLQAKAQLPVWQEKQRQAEAEQTQLTSRKQALQEESRQRCGKLQETLAVLTSDLQKAEKKAQEYIRMHIEETIERAAKKDEWESRYKSLQEEQRILTSQYTEISAKYKSLIQNLDEQWNKIHEAKIRQREEITNAYNLRQEEAGHRREAETEALYQEYEMLSQQLNPEKNRLHSELTALNYRMQLCMKENFFAEEQDELKHRIQSYTGLHMSKKNRIENCQLIIKEIGLQWEKELQDGNKEIDNQLAQLQLELQTLRPRVEELDTFLRNNKNSLQGWLKEHKKAGKKPSGNCATRKYSGRRT